MKILLITLDYYPSTGGVAEYYGKLAKHWPDISGLEILDNRNNQLMSPKLPYLKWLPSLLTIYKKIKQTEYDHIIIGQILPLGIAARWLKKILNFRFSVVLHGMDIASAIRTPRKKRQIRKILLAAEKVIANTDYTAGIAKKTMQGMIDDKVFIVTPGVDPEEAPNFSIQEIQEFKKRFGLEDKLVLLTIGRLVKRKGVDQVILALSKMNAYWPKLAYVIVGGGPDEEYLKDLANSLPSNFSKHIIFTGPKTGIDKWRWLAACDIFLMTARDDNGDVESFGIVYLEAGLMNKPVIAGKTGGVGEAVTDGVTGIMVDPRNTDDIAESIIELINNPQTRKDLGEQGRERSLKEFGWEDRARHIYNILK